MPGKRKRSIYRKKRKGKAFTGIQRYENRAETQEVLLSNDDQISSSSNSTSIPQPSTSSENNQPMSASRMKLKCRTVSSSSPDSSDCEKDDSVEGYRLIDIAEFASTLSNDIHVCEGGKRFLNSN